MARRAMTLIELMLVGGLLVLLFGVVYSFLVPGLRAWSRSDAQSQAQQQCLLVASFVTREIEYALPYNIQIIRPPESNAVHGDGLVFVSSLDDRHEDHFDAAGSPLWQKIIYIYHVPERGEVRIRRMPIDPPVPDPPVPDWTAFHPADDDHVIARNVRSMALTMEGWGGLLLPLRVVVAAEVEGRTSTLETCAVPIYVTEPMPDVHFSPAPPETE